jgi:pectate lyase
MVFFREEELVRNPGLFAAAIVTALLLSACPSVSDPDDADDQLVETTLVIQETADLAQGGGFVSTTGQFRTDKTGYTGPGFISYLGAASNIVYSVRAEAAGPYKLSFRYSFGGAETNLRDAYIVVNGARVQADDDAILELPYTGDWASWADSAVVTVLLIAGDNNIRIQPAAGTTRTIALSSGGSATGTVTGLPNMDYMKITGAGPSAGTNSTVFYTLSAGVKTEGTGTIVISPEQDFYLGGTTIVLAANPGTGYQFESWTGTIPSTLAAYSFQIRKDMSLSARFLPVGTVQQSGLVGFASVQDDLATPYILTGGYGGAELTVSTLADLTDALTSADPMIVRVSGLITTADDASVSMDVASNKTLLSDPAVQGHLKNIELKLSGENYIIRDLIFSEVIAADVIGGAGNDCIQLNGARHAWIDHCELYSSLGPSPIDVDGDGDIDSEDAKDYYDGLLDIKNGASFITLSNNYFHDHWKAILAGSGDDITNQAADGRIRLTMCGNYLKDVNSRMPLIRYGKAHVFNNCFVGDSITIDSTVNARCSSEVKVEGNHFENCKNTVGFFYDTSGYPAGTWNLVDNTFVNVTAGAPASTGNWSPAYAYTAAASSGISLSVPAAAGVDVISP